MRRERVGDGGFSCEIAVKCVSHGCDAGGGVGEGGFDAGDETGISLCRNGELIVLHGVMVMVLVRQWGRCGAVIAASFISVAKVTHESARKGAIMSRRGGEMWARLVGANRTSGVLITPYEKKAASR